MVSNGSGWFAVRCLFKSGWSAFAGGAVEGVSEYEERITLWRAENAEEAIAKAESEADLYAASIDEAPDEYLGLAQSYALSDTPSQEGAEIFSMIRSSRLTPDDYLEAFFDTGDEHIANLVDDDSTDQPSP